MMASLVLLSFTSRLFGLHFLEILRKTRLANINLFVYFLPLYLLPVLIPLEISAIFFISVFALTRGLIGIFFSLSYGQIKINDEIINPNDFSTKYWLSYTLGLALGSFIFLFINEIYSNDDLNKWGWKIFYFFMFFSFLFSYIFSKYIFGNKITLCNQPIIEKDYKKRTFSSFASNLILLIPITSFILFCSSTWLPKFGNPENLQFLNYNLLYLFLTILIFIFVNPLANLVGRRKSILFFNFSIIIISIFCSFLSHRSSYSIDFLKFFISLISSFSICCYLMQSRIKRIVTRDIALGINIIFCLSSLLLPFLFYYFIHYSINYYGVYIFFALVYFINYIIFLNQKNG
jgi:hypothetical protein